MTHADKVIFNVKTDDTTGQTVMKLRMIFAVNYLYHFLYCTMISHLTHRSRFQLRLLTLADSVHSPAEVPSTTVQLVASRPGADCHAGDLTSVLRDDGVGQGLDVSVDVFSCR